MPANGSADAARDNKTPRTGRKPRLSAKHTRSQISLPSLAKGFMYKGTRKPMRRGNNVTEERGHGPKPGWDGRGAYNLLPTITLQVEQLFSSDWLAAAEQEQARRAVQRWRGNAKRAAVR